MRNSIDTFVKSMLSATLLVAIVTPHSSMAETYNYDAQGRLTRVVYDDNTSINYTYDDAGNIVQTQIGGKNGAPATFDLISPGDGATELATSVTFVWNEATDPEGDDLSYQIFVCEDIDFLGCTATDVPQPAPAMSYSGAGGLLGGFAFFLAITGAGLGGRAARRPAMIVACIMAVGILSACGGGGGGGGGNAEPPDPDPPVTDVSYTVANLDAATTYYWKVAVSDGVSTTESLTWTFVTQ